MSERQMKKAIEEASDKELRDFAELTLQLEVPDTITRANLLALMGPAWPAPFVYVDAAELDEAADVQTDTARAEARVTLGKGRYRDDPKWLIRISNTELPGGKDPVSVGVNGDVVVIQRAMEVECPHRFIGALRDAVRVSVGQDPKTQELIFSKFTNYPLEVLERPSRTEIETFEERTKDLTLV